MPTKTFSAEEARPTPDLPCRAPDSKSRALSPVWFVLGMGALAVVARLALLWPLPLPQCWLRKLTGVPCPSCGCTRSLAAWATLDLEQAFRFNPLFFLLCVALLAWSALRLAERFSRRTFPDGLKLRFKN